MNDNIKCITTGKDNLIKIGNGINTSVDAIAGTFGPMGKIVNIDDSYANSFTPTKDGYAVAKTIKLEDAVENIGAKAVRRVCKHIADSAGDGTTTGSILFRSMYELSANLILSNQWSRETSEGIEYGVEQAINFLQKQAEHIDTGNVKRIAEIATISTNDDKKLGQLVSEIVAKVGPDGVISVSDSKSMDTYCSYIDGMKISRGFTSPYFKNSTTKEVCEMESVHVLVYNDNIDTIQKLSKMSNILEAIKGEPLLIFCAGMTNDALLKPILIGNAHGATKICVSKLPDTHGSKNDIAEDIAAFVGAKFIDESKGMDLAKCTIEDLGKVNKIIVDAHSTTLIGGQGSEAAIQARCDQIQNQINDTNMPEYQRNALQDRYANLKGIAAVIHVGGILEEKQKEVKYRLEDAIQAAKSAVKHGIIPGGSSSLVRASKYLNELKNAILRNPQVQGSNLPFSYNKDGDQMPCSNQFIHGISIIEEALCAPLQQILLNAGKDKEWQTIIHAIQNSSDDKIGYDVINARLDNMYNCGIIDPLSSPTEALRIASSVLLLTVTSHASITDKPSAKESSYSPMNMY